MIINKGNQLSIFSLLISNLILVNGTANSGLSQIVPDQTLGNENSVVAPNILINGINSDRIEGGAIRGTNLFHSFQEFNIDGARAVYFTNPALINNILTRVTGSNSSNILGTLGVLGNANLLLLNPKGIFFGANSSLDVKSSFLATTANGIKLANGDVFSSRISDPLPNQILNVTPSALLFNQGNNGRIRIQGQANTLPNDGTFAFEQSLVNIDPNDPPSLRVPFGKTLAFVGTNVDLESGLLIAPGGRIELGSVMNGEVKIIPSVQGWQLDYQGVQNFQNLQVRQQTYVAVSGSSSGDAQLVGQQISLTDGSEVVSNNLGAGSAGTVVVKAEDLKLDGAVKLPGISRELASGFFVQAFGAGNGGNIEISTRTLFVREGRITVTSLTEQPGVEKTGSEGQIKLNATESVELTGSTVVRNFTSGMDSRTFSKGNGGDIMINTPHLVLRNGAQVSASTFSDGQAGTVIVNADLVEIIGRTLGDNGRFPSAFIANVNNNAAVTRGNGGSVRITTDTLSVREGGFIAVSVATRGTGNGGSLIIQAKNIELSGSGIDGSINPPTVVPSTISALTRGVGNAGNIEITAENLVVKDGAILTASSTDTATGRGGSIMVKTNQLTLSNHGSMAVNSAGVGTGGNIFVEANSLTATQSAISASTVSGEGGNITLKIEDLRLRQNTPISATAGGTGNGGNITLNTDTLLALEDSDITANAVKGRGGNIQITAQGIFLSSDSQITATSETGINGVVAVNTLGIDLKNTLTSLKGNFVSPEQVVAGSCLAQRNQKEGSFTLTGTGGLPRNPVNAIDGKYILNQVRPISDDLRVQKSYSVSEESNRWKLGDRIQEAQNIVIATDGTKILTSLPSLAVTPISNLICSSN